MPVNYSTVDHYDYFDYYMENLSLELGHLWNSSGIDVKGSRPTTKLCFNEVFRNYKDFTQVASVRILFIVAYIVVTVVALIGNTLVVMTIVKHQHMRTSTNYFILNLAVCDFFICSVAMPLKLLEYLAPCDWNVFQYDVTCALCGIVLPIFVFTSVLTVCAISLGRYALLVAFL